jgi:hypothetical protein
MTKKKAKGEVGGSSSKKLDEPSSSSMEVFDFMQQGGLFDTRPLKESGK